MAVSSGGTPVLTLVYSSAEADGTSSVAWGDYDGDGDLDLAVGNGDPHRHLSSPQPVRLYRNGGVAPNGTPIFTLAWSAPTADRTTSVAWGDYDGDGDLDLAVSNEWDNQVYCNDGASPDRTPIFTLAWSSSDGGGAGVAWGDYDSDGNLDLASSRSLYHNNGGTLTSVASWSSSDGGGGTAAWGDYDSDGDLDLRGCRIGCTATTAGTLTGSAVWVAPESSAVQSVAWGDYDGDGDLDLAVANWVLPLDYIATKAGASSGKLPGSRLRVTQPPVQRGETSTATVISI